MTYRNGTEDEITAGNVARSLTNDALAMRLDVMSYGPRSFSKVEREAFLLEASKRLSGQTRRGAACSTCLHHWTDVRHADNCTEAVK